MLTSAAMCTPQSTIRSGLSGVICESVQSPGKVLFTSCASDARATRSLSLSLPFLCSSHCFYSVGTASNKAPVGTDMRITHFLTVEDSKRSCSISFASRSCPLFLLSPFPLGSTTSDRSHLTYNKFVLMWRYSNTAYRRFLCHI